MVFVSATDIQVWQGKFLTGPTSTQFSFNFTVYDNVTGGTQCYNTIVDLTTNSDRWWITEPVGVLENCTDSDTDYHLQIVIDGVDQPPRRLLKDLKYADKTQRTIFLQNLTTMQSFDAESVDARDPTPAMGLSIGGPDFAKFSAQSINGTIDGVPFNRITTVLNVGMAVAASFPFTQTIANLNVNPGGNASALIGAINYLNHGVSIVKYTDNFQDPELAQFANNFGSFRFQNRNEGNSTITIGFYDEVLRVPDGSVIDLLNQTRVIVMHNSLQSNPFITQFNFDLNVTGNFTGNQIYGEMFFFDLDNPTTIVIPGLGLANATNITNMGPGLMNGFSFMNNNSLIAQVPGIYKAEWNLVYEDSTNSKHGFSITINGVFQNNTGSAGIITNANDVSNPGGSGLIRLEEGDVINLVAGDRFAPISDVDILSANLNLLRVGH